MFTQDFRKFRLALATMVTAVLLYAGINIGFLALSHKVEGQSDVYPYKDEDWLRYLLPALFENRGKNRIMLVGESAVRENLLYEEFDRAFPRMQTFQGGLSLGAIDDLLISLEYIEQVYGRAALPRVLVLGISPRFAANLPEKRPFLQAIRRYSPYFDVETTPGGPRLVPKTFLNGWVSRLRFVLLKQQKRYLGSLSVLARSSIQTDAFEATPKLLLSKREILYSLIRQPRETFHKIIHESVTEWVRRWASPYKYHDLLPIQLEGLRGWLRSADSWWRRVHNWNPESSKQMIADRFGRLYEFVRSREIRLYAINLPENIESRQLYDNGNYRRYMDFVRKSLGDTPYLDLREFLNPGEFYDAIHATLPGAKRVTGRVVRFIKDQGDIASEFAGRARP